MLILGKVRPSIKFKNVIQNQYMPRRVRAPSGGEKREINIERVIRIQVAKYGKAPINQNRDKRYCFSLGNTLLKQYNY